MIALLLLALALAPRPAAPAIVPPTPNPRPTIPVMRLHLPVGLGWPPAQATRPSRPTIADLRTTIRPDTSPALAAALRVPGALVLPAAGEYRQGSAFRMAAGTTLDGRGMVTIRGGILIERASGATVRGVRIQGAPEDGISVVKTGGHVLIEHVDITGSADGCLDVVRSEVAGLTVTVRDVTIHGCRKAMLLGHYDPGLDAALVVLLERVTFTDCDARTPKVHRATVTMRDSRVIRWGSRAVDAQLGARIALSGVRFDEGPNSGPRIRLETGGLVSETGTVFVAYRPVVGSE